jgi:hypothetical protein
MTEDDSIYVDASQPAVLHFADTTVECPTLHEAVIAWRRLPPEIKERATIRVIDGPVYQAGEVARLTHGPAPSAA